jgi:hypothetical protein
MGSTKGAHLSIGAFCVAMPSISQAQLLAVGKEQIAQGWILATAVSDTYPAAAGALLASRCVRQWERHTKLAIENAFESAKSERALLAANSCLYSSTSRSAHHG